MERRLWNTQSNLAFQSGQDCTEHYPPVIIGSSRGVCLQAADSQGWQWSQVTRPWGLGEFCPC